MKRKTARLLPCGLVLALLVQLLTPAGFVHAEGSADGDFAYTVTDGTATITDYLGSAGFQDTVTIPATIDDYAVTAIGKDAFSYGNFAAVSIPSSVTSIGSGAFEGCPNLAIVTIPDSVTSVGLEAFEDTPWIENYPDKYVVVGDGLLIKYKAPVFTGSTQVLTLPNTVKVISDKVFADTSYIEEVTLPDSVKVIGNEAFSNCRWLKTIHIGDGVETIGTGAFWRCSDLATVHFGKNVSTIGGVAFYSCSALTSVTLPKSVTSVPCGAFDECDNLGEINVEDGCAAYTDVNGVLFSGDMTTLVCFPNGMGGDYTVPTGVTAIGGGAFSDNRRLIGVTLPAGVTSIGSSAFAGCRYLKRVNIPAGVTAIADHTFDECQALASVTLPSGVETIGAEAFADAGLTSIRIPDSVKTVGARAFDGCNDLTEVVIGDGVESIDERAFWGCDALAAVTFGDSVTAIGDYAFYTCKKLTTLQLPNTLKTVGECAFCGTSLTGVTLGENIESIGSRAFSSKNLMYVLLTGDAPQVDSDPFSNEDFHLTVLYKQGATGFTNPWNGYTTVAVDSADSADITVPGTVKDITYTRLSQSSLRINWAATAGADGYVVYRRTHSNGTYELIATQSGTSFTDTGLAMGPDYYYAYAAYVTVGEGRVYGPLFKASSYWTLRPDPPKNVRIEVVSDDEVRISWDPMPDADGYIVTCQSDPSSSNTQDIATTSNTSCRDMYPTDGSIYYVQSYILYRSDKLAGARSEPVTLNLRGDTTTDTITSAHYTVSGGYVGKIPLGTTVGTFLGKLDNQTGVTVYKGNTAVSNRAKLGTGMTVKLTDGTAVKQTLTVTVTGDTNGDGTISITDMLAVKADILGKQKLSGAAKTAADVSGDSAVSITDFIQIKAHVLGKSTVIAR